MVDEARLDTLLDCKVGELPGLLRDWIKSGEVTTDEACMLMRSVVHGVLVPFLMLFRADGRLGLAVETLARISRTVLNAPEINGGDDAKSLH